MDKMMAHCLTKGKPNNFVPARCKTSMATRDRKLVRSNRLIFPIFTLITRALIEGGLIKDNENSDDSLCISLAEREKENQSGFVLIC